MIGDRSGRDPQHLTLAANPGAVQRFRQEAKIDGLIDSPFIVSVIDVGVDVPTQTPYLVMEFLNGEDLEARVERLGPRPPTEVVAHLGQVKLDPKGGPYRYERIETESELGDIGAERLRELKTKRDEVLRTLAKLKPMHFVPPYLYEPETIQRFQGRLREALLGRDRATARVYLQNLVDHIVVGEDEIIIEAHPGAALAMMSASGTTPPEANKREVLADVVDWRGP